MIEAKWYQKLPEAGVRCLLCHHQCLLKPGQTGFCRSKQNSAGTLVAVQYGNYTSLALDPIEKKPLYHFYPGRAILSIGNNSCNLACGFCQNWQISQVQAPTRSIDPVQLATLARERGSIGVAYTYAEPLMWYEFILDAAREVHNAGLLNVLVTNGSIAQEPLQELLPLIDAWNIDLKSMRDEFYRRVCKGNLAQVLATIQTVCEAHRHLELTNLVIPNHNDSESEIEDLAKWLAALDPQLVLHFSRYHPQFNFQEQPTPMNTLLRCRAQALQYLTYVYVGNVCDDALNSTYCVSCSTRVIHRDGYRVLANLVREGKCPKCGASVPIIGD